MKTLNQYIEEKLVLNNNAKVRKYNYRPKTKDELKELVKQLIKERGNDADLNDIDTSRIINMSDLFVFTEFNGDISLWNVSNVTDMTRMFYECKNFNGDLSEWDVSKVIDMSFMFHKSKFNGDISKWNVVNVKYMTGMFKESEFNRDISNWNNDKLLDATDMFKDCPIKEEYKPKLNK